jgi:hypothetical protein
LPVDAAAHNRRYRERHRTQGLCRSCPLPSRPGKATCERHSSPKRTRGYRAVKWDRQKISNEAVIAMRFERAEGASLKDLAAKYGISYHHVSLVCTGRARRALGGPRTLWGREVAS